MGLATDNQTAVLQDLTRRVERAEAELAEIMQVLKAVNGFPAAALDSTGQPDLLASWRWHPDRDYPPVPENPEGTPYEVFLDLKAQWERNIEDRAVRAAQHVEPAGTDEA